MVIISIFICNIFIFILQEIINIFNAEDASSIAIVQKLLKESSTQQNVLYIAKNVSSFFDSMKQIEERNLEFVKVFEVFHLALRKIGVAYGDIGKKITRKMIKLLQIILV